MPLEILIAICIELPISLPFKLSYKYVTRNIGDGIA
jgi:hypothetical protein